MTNTPRRLARTRAETACQSPAVNGHKQRRMHSGTKPGAPVGNRNAWKHGAQSAELLALTSALRWLIF